MVTRKKKLREIPMPTWLIQHVEALTMHGGQDIADGDEPLYVDHFSKKNDFSAALHEYDIAGATQDKDEQDGDNNDDNSNRNEDPEKPLGLSHDPTAARGKISVVSPPEHPV